MAIQPCTIVVDDKRQELYPHGTPDFPCGCYDTEIEDYVIENIAWHWHEELELIIVCKGSVLVSAGQSNLSLHHGEGVFINSNVLHSIQGLDAERSLLHSFVIHPNLLCGTLDSIFMQKYITPLISSPDLSFLHLHPKIDWQYQILSNVEQAYQAFRTEEFGYEFTVRELLTNACMLIVRNKQQYLTAEDQNNKTDINRIKVMLSYIHQHYPEELEVKHIADYANVSTRECLRSFQEILHISPIQYLIKYRISTSAQLLTETDLNITEICASCGFPSPSYYTKMFKRYIGNTPTEYRRQFSKALPA